jgi:hypothetical protein
MKTVRSLLMVWMVMLVLIGTTDALQAQGRGKGSGHPGRGKSGDNHPGRGHDKGEHPGRGKDKGHEKRDDRDYDRDHRDDRDRDYSYRDHDHDSRRDYSRHDYRKRYVTYNHHRHGTPSWAPAYGHRYNTRYIYYRDYNVYYDCHRDLFLTWYAGRWVITTRVPDVICHVDFRRAVVVGVDYWDDDFNFYLERRRPAFISISASW